MNRLLLPMLCLISSQAISGDSMQSYFESYEGNSILEDAASEKPLPEVVKIPNVILAGTASGQYKVNKSFNVGTDLIGWSIESLNGAGLILYSTRDGYVINGNVIDPDGTELNEKHKKEYLVYIEPDNSVNPEDLVIREGQGKTVVEIYWDPNCSYCHDLWLGLREYLDDVTILWRPVSLQSGSDRIIDSIFAHQDPLEALTMVENGQSLPAAKIDKAIRSGVRVNMNRMSTLGVTGTPSGLVKWETGEEQLFSGAGILYSIKANYR